MMKYNIHQPDLFNVLPFSALGKTVFWALGAAFQCYNIAEYPGFESPFEAVSVLLIPFTLGCLVASCFGRHKGSVLLSASLFLYLIGQFFVVLGGIISSHWIHAITAPIAFVCSIFCSYCFFKVILNNKNELPLGYKRSP